MMFAAMAIDLEKERQRLIALYASMPSEQLEQIASRPSELTEMAQQVLEIEMGGRQLLPLSSNQAQTSIDETADVNLVLARSFRGLLEAHLAKASLDSAGIESFLADDNMVAMDWFRSDAIGGVKLLVRETDMADATAVLNQPAPESFDIEGVGEYRQPHCPQCGSSEVSLGAPLHAYSEFGNDQPLPAQGWYCQHLQTRLGRA